MNRIEAILAPAELESLSQRDLSRSICVVFDVLRATSSMVTALANGASGIIPVVDIPEALSVHARNPGSLLAGERHGWRIGSDLTGTRDFDLGNSPREFTRNIVDGKKIVMTTTNGTRALKACEKAGAILACSFGNLAATASAVGGWTFENLVLVAAGTYDESAYEDILGIGALIERLTSSRASESWTDSAATAHTVWGAAKSNPLGALIHSKNGRRLMGIPELREDVALCLATDTYDFPAHMKQGEVRKGVSSK